MAQVYFITGASSGFGRALAEAVLARGGDVVAAARRPERLAELSRAGPGRLLPLTLDVTDAQARVDAVRQALARFGRIDVLADIAGRGSLGAAEEFSADELRGQLEVNFVSAAEMVRAILPAMRAQGSGHVLNLTSIGGLVARGGFAAYAASRFALEGWSEALRDEVAAFGIRVTLVEPGAFRTEFAGAAILRPADAVTDYRQMLDPIAAYLDGSDGRQAGDPARAAAAMIGAVESDRPPLRLMLGRDAYAMWDEKVATITAELSAGRASGEATALDGDDVPPIALVGQG